jgi:hypothetical protein
MFGGRQHRCSVAGRPAGLKPWRTRARLAGQSRRTTPPDSARSPRRRRRSSLPLPRRAARHSACAASASAACNQPGGICACTYQERCTPRPSVTNLSCAPLDTAHVPWAPQVQYGAPTPVLKPAPEARRTSATARSPGRPRSSSRAPPGAKASKPAAAPSRARASLSARATGAASAGAGLLGHAFPLGVPRVSPHAGALPMLAQLGAPASGPRWAVRPSDQSDAYGGDLRAALQLGHALMLEAAHQAARRWRPPAPAETGTGSQNRQCQPKQPKEALPAGRAPGGAKLAPSSASSARPAACGSAASSARPPARPRRPPARRSARSAALSRSASASASAPGAPTPAWPRSSSRRPVFCRRARRALGLCGTGGSGPQVVLRRVVWHADAVVRRATRIGVTMNQVARRAACFHARIRRGPTRRAALPQPCALTLGGACRARDLHGARPAGAGAEHMPGRRPAAAGQAARLPSVFSSLPDSTQGTHGNNLICTVG